MNERLLELYRQAHVPNTAIDPSNNMPYETTCFSEEKFAELIVQECLFIIDDERKPEMVSRVELWKQIVEHFGIDV